MRLLSFMAALVGVGMLMSSAPAFATDQAGAIKICERSGACNITRGQGGIMIGVKTPAGGENYVWCPDSGPCECTLCAPGRRGGDIGFRLRPHGWGLPQSLTGPEPSSNGTVMPAPAPANQPPIL